VVDTEEERAPLGGVGAPLRPVGLDGADGQDLLDRAVSARFETQADLRGEGEGTARCGAALSAWRQRALPLIGKVIVSGERGMGEAMWWGWILGAIFAVLFVAFAWKTR
jgi:hypothetical protein